MPHIKLSAELPGIRGPFAFRPETAKPMSELAEVLLHTPGSLSMADSELIATFVSSRNDCHYCQTSHGAIAAYHLGGNEQLVLDVKRDFENAGISDKLKALLNIAGRVQQGGKLVRPEDVERARSHGATDIEIHDTVLIAAAFCMYNRYVDGLATWAPADMDSYRQRAAAVSENGYLGILATVTAQAAGSKGE
ncbi:carboxymuconolactone decarboxylase family protein [Paludibaculum fermentans]|uniref:carboxymuconolactone decarboxylase family protein n=1 Tax=Paludibaculum fermentans TaxID=1473598 RepID=UPI003EBEF534